MKNFPRMGYVFLLAMILAGCGSGPESTVSSSYNDTVSQNNSVFLRLPINLINKEFVKRTGFIRDHKYDNEYAFGYIKRPALELLTRGEAAEIVELNEDFLKHVNYDPKTLKVIPDPTVERALTNGDLGDVWPARTEYYTYPKLKEKLGALQQTYPNLAKMESAGRSVKGKELFYMKISDNVTVNESEPNLLYIANMHGDESVGREMMVYLIELLLTNYSTDSRIKNLVDNAQIFIMPSMNPDGFEAQNRENAAGVDLNRDFPDFTSDPNDTPDGRGTETRLIMELHKKYQFELALNFHGGEVVINLPWDTQSNTTEEEKFGDDKVMYRLARQYADTNPTMKNGGFDQGLTYGYEWYEVDGGMQDWASYYRDSIHATVEVSYTKYPSASSLPTYWKENKEALIQYLEGGLLGIHLNILDKQGNPIKKTTVGMSSSRRNITFSINQIHRAAIPGDQTITVQAPNFQTKTISVKSSAFNGTFTKVTLE